MAGSVRLTIGIPTYNGAAYIRNALDSVIRQVSGELSSQVDILISDNASTDETPEIIKSYQESQSVRIQYSRNIQNVGFDRNVDMLFKNASGQYIWLLADDDSLKDGALPLILDLLKQHQHLKVVLVNFDQYDRKLEQLVDQVTISEDIYCHDADTFLRNAKERYNLVSSLIIDKAAWNAEDLSMGMGLSFIHVYALLKIILHSDSYIVQQSLVNMRMGSANSGTSGDALLRIALDSGSIIRSMRNMGYDPEIIQWLLKDARRYIYDTIPIAKLSGLKNRSIAIKRLVSIQNSPTLWLKWVPVIICPDVIFRKLYFAKKSISSKTRIIERKLKEFIKKSS